MVRPNKKRSSVKRLKKIYLSIFSTSFPVLVLETKEKGTTRSNLSVVEELYRGLRRSVTYSNDVYALG